MSAKPEQRENSVLRDVFCLDSSAVARHIGRAQDAGLSAVNFLALPDPDEKRSPPTPAKPIRLSLVEQTAECLREGLRGNRWAGVLPSGSRLTSANL